MYIAKHIGHHGAREIKVVVSVYFRISFEYIILVLNLG